MRLKKNNYYFSTIMVIVACGTIILSQAKAFSADANVADTGGKADSTLRHVQFLLPHLRCKTCMLSLANSLRSSNGVQDLVLGLPPVRLVVTYDSFEASRQDLINIMKKEGQTPDLLFDVPEREFNFSLLGKRRSKLFDVPLNDMKLPEPRMP